MERFLQPKTLDVDPNAAGSEKRFRHWHRSFSFFLSSIEHLNVNKLEQLVNYVSTDIYDHISDCKTFDEAVSQLETLFIKPRNEVFCRHLLSIARQEPTESVDQYLQRLKHLARDCDYKAVSAEVHRDEGIRDVFIRGLRSPPIRQRILESRNIDLVSIASQARSLELAQEQSTSYLTAPTLSTPDVCSAIPTPVRNADIHTESDCEENFVASSTEQCYFCGLSKHPRFKCPARDAICKFCNKRGHFKKVCKALKQTKPKSFASAVLSSVTSAAVPSSLSTAIINVMIDGDRFSALVDTGSSDSYISSSVFERHNWRRFPSSMTITMASSELQTATKGHCFVELFYNNTFYQNVKLSIVDQLCSDVLLGHDFLRQHKAVVIPFHGDKESLTVCGLLAAKVDPPDLFAHLTPNCTPIATKSRRHSLSDQRFIANEVKRLLDEGIIEPSRSPWRAQVLVASNSQHKRRMVVDYSQTINRFTDLDAYPLPRIDEMVERIAQYDLFSTLDLQSAYHQVPIRESDRIYTAFEADGALYQFCRVPFGVTNGVACFQRVIDDIIRKSGLKDTFAYVDNVTICGTSPESHNTNLAAFMSAANSYGLTFNSSKSILAQPSIRLLGYEVSKNSIKPDPDRMKALRELPPPHNTKAQQRVIGLFAYYSQWIRKYSEKIRPLVINKSFPLSPAAHDAFNLLKAELEHAAIVSVDQNVPFVVETDASDVAISATLNQNGKPVAFFSRTLSQSEQHYASIEKEAHAVVESIRKWRHYLLGRQFTVVTDQKSVAFMYNSRNKSKIKNDKIQRWKVELSSYQFDVVYRPGKDNAAADALSRAHCGAIHDRADLAKLHASLCHPGIVRMAHFVRTKNLPYSTEEIKSVTAQCKTCAQWKPRFYKPPPGRLIKATQPFERLSIDFKGPLPSSSNQYMLTVVDEFSRFPFAFACKDMSTHTVLKHLDQLFAIFGTPSYVHSDRGQSFMSAEFVDYLRRKGANVSHTTAYNPRANGQVERLNGTLWRTINLALHCRGLPISRWEDVLDDALHCIRSLLCTATNTTPHERLFSYQRRSTTGKSLPTWLSSPGPVLLKRMARSSKYDPLVDEVELLECNPSYARIRLPDGRQDNVSLSRLAPAELPVVSPESPTTPHEEVVNQSPAPSVTEESTPMIPVSQDNVNEIITKQQRVHPYSLRNREA